MATVAKRGNSYRIKVSLGYDSNGKQIIKSKTWTPEKGASKKQIQKELNKQTILFEEKCKKGLVLDSSIKFSEFAEKWIKDYGETQLRPRTLARYKELLKRINISIGHIKLEKLQPHHLTEFYKNLFEEGIRNDTKYKPFFNFDKFVKDLKITKVSLAKLSGVSIQVINLCFKGLNVNYQSALKISNALNKKIDDVFEPFEAKKYLSPKTMLYYHRLISVIMSTAVQWQLIISNPCERVKPPKVSKKEAKYLDEHQAKKLLSVIQNEDIKYKTIIEVLIYTEMRRGELCGLTWDDIDFKNKLLNINKSILYLSDRGVFEDLTKNQSSNRVIPISDNVIKSLKEYKKYQESQKLLLGSKWNGENNKIFTSWNGGNIHPDTISD